METFKYETHLHTTEGSACASACAVDYIDVYKKNRIFRDFCNKSFFRR